MKSWWLLGGLAAVVASCAPAAAGCCHRPVPGVAAGTPGVDTYIENPDPQPPVVWSQGTAPPPPQGDYGGGFIQYLITGHERRPEAPRVYAPAPTGLAYPPPAVAYAAPGEPSAPAVYAAPQVVHAAPNPIFRRQIVDFAGHQTPGTIIIDTTQKFLYLVQGGGHAMRYGIGVARPGFLWAGEKTITRKAEWPDWTPPSEMLARRPDLPRHMIGGIENPLGARAMYLGSSLYRIHGTNEPDTIGTNVSSGCIRLLNEDVSDLYDRVHVGTHVIVM